MSTVTAMRDRVRAHPWGTVYLVLGLVPFFAVPAPSPKDTGVNIGLGLVAILWMVPGTAWLLGRLHRNLHPPRHTS